jgi:hypothetical protein
MSLILAIEPDRRQAAQLTRLIQTRVGAELVLAETTEQALGAIGNRVPDLVLVPALLAPLDDATLAAALRVIAAAAHVQMLTIPVLAPARVAGQPLGVLARLRRRRTDPVAPDGCDPDVFGDQIAAYLAEAAAERAINESDLAIELSTITATDSNPLSQVSPDLPIQVIPGSEQSIGEPAADQSPLAAAAEGFMVMEPAVDPAPIEPDPQAAMFAVPVVDAIVANDLGRSDAFEEPDAELAAPIALLTASEPTIADAGTFTLAEAVAGHPAAINEVEPIVTLDARSEAEPAARIELAKPFVVSEAPWFGPLRRWPDLEGQETVDRLTASVVDDTADADWYTANVPAVEAPSFADLPAELAAMDEPAPVVIETLPIDVPVEPAAIDTRSVDESASGAVPDLWMPLSSGSTRVWPVLEGSWTEARPDPPVVAHANAPAAAAAPPAPASVAERAAPSQEVPEARPEWIELIESLRQDVKRLRSERTQPVAGTRTRQSPPLLRAAGADGEPPQKRGQASKPAQDEWGFFDPEQCGFAALLAKLDEITHVGDVP